VQPPDELVLGVGLPDGHREPELLADPLAQRDELGVRGDAVDVGLAGAEPPEVGPVEHVHVHDDTSA
jgi:hypothetical protein